MKLNIYLDYLDFVTYIFYLVPVSFFHLLVYFTFEMNLHCNIMYK